MSTSRVPLSDFNSTLSGLKKLLFSAGTGLEIKQYPNWRQGSGPYEYADWYISSRLPTGQVEASTIMAKFEKEPWQKSRPHYDFMTTNEDLGSRESNFLIGSAHFGIGMAFSTYRFTEDHIRSALYRLGYRSLPLPLKQLRDLCIETETMHEGGHVFGAARDRWGADVLSGSNKSETLYKDHCANDGCIMRQGRAVPDAWVKATLDRIESGRDFCYQCETDMRNYFTSV